MTGGLPSARAEVELAATASIDPWPRGVSQVPEFSIGELVAIIRSEFPATTVSKIRFLEDKGLVKPYRTASGYRKYSRANVERIRFVLTQQRDSYAPLRVIHEQLVALDAGHDVGPIPTARLVAAEGKIVVPPSKKTLTAREITDLTGVSPDQLSEYARLGLITPDLGGHFAPRAVRIVALLADMGRRGIPPRLLRSVKLGAERSTDIVDQVVSSRQNRDRPGEQERSRAQISDLTELFGDLHQEFLSLAADTLMDY